MVLVDPVGVGCTQLRTLIHDNKNADITNPFLLLPSHFYLPLRHSHLSVSLTILAHFSMFNTLFHQWSLSSLSNPHLAHHKFKKRKKKIKTENCIDNCVLYFVSTYYLVKKFKIDFLCLWIKFLGPPLDKAIENWLSCLRGLCFLDLMI